MTHKDKDDTITTSQNGKASRNFTRLPLDNEKEIERLSISFNKHLAHLKSALNNIQIDSVRKSLNNND